MDSPTDNRKFLGSEHFGGPSQEGIGVKMGGLDRPLKAWNRA